MRVSLAVHFAISKEYPTQQTIAFRIGVIEMDDAIGEASDNHFFSFNFET